jgi:kumamolisin
LVSALLFTCAGLAFAQDPVQFYAQPPIHIITGPDVNAGGPPPSAETPGSLACVYELVKQTKGCPIATSKTLPTGGWGAIALVDAFDNRQAANDVKVGPNSSVSKSIRSRWSSLLASGRCSIQAGPSKSRSISRWQFQWRRRLRFYLVEAASNNNSDQYFAEKVAANLVAKAGGGVISNSWQGGENSTEDQVGKTYFNHPGVVYFASSGDGGYNHTGFPAVSPYVVAAGGTQIIRSNGNFQAEWYWSGGGSGLSQYESRPPYQDIIKKIVGTKRGVPDFSAVATNVPVYSGSNGVWFVVAGTSISRHPCLPASSMLQLARQSRVARN